MTGLVLFAMLLVAAHGCETQMTRQNKMQGDIKMEESNEALESVSLETNISLQDKVLTVEYRIKNKSAKAIYLFNVLWEFSPDGKCIPAPQPFYTLLQDNGTLHLAKEIPPLPKNKRVELKLVPFATKVEAGKEFSEKLELSAPLAEYNPYFPKEKDESEELKTADRIEFSIQYVSEIEGLEVKEAPVGKALAVWHPDLASNTNTLSSKPKTVVVQVKKRADYFERF